MISVYQKVGIPCGIVCLVSIICTVLFFGFYLPSNESDHFQKLITAENPEPYLDRITASLDFQKRNLAVKTSSVEAGFVADGYFKIGEALAQRNQEKYQESAINYYTQAYELYPPIRHGWPFFQIARLHESQQKWEKAYGFYEKVSRYDYGLLSLEAGYRKACMQIKLGTSPDSAAAYRYIRFSSKNPADALPFIGYSGMDAIADLVLGGLANYAQSAPANPEIPSETRQKAIAAFDLYLLRNPQDPYVQSLHNPGKFSNQKENMLKTCYAPRSIQNGTFILLSEGHILADVYSPALAGNHFIAEITVENDAGLAKKVLFSLNKGSEVIELDCPKSNTTLRAHFAKMTGNDVVDLSFANTEEALSFTNPSAWLTIRGFSINPEPESQH